MARIDLFRLLTGAAWVLPLLVLLAAYGAIALYTGNGWPWLEVVHEAGDRTLIGTVLYYQHAARELPLDLVLGLALGGSALWAFPAAGVASRGRQAGLAAGTLLVVGAIVGGTLVTGGWPMLWDNLLQMHTRPGEALNWGAHWRYHFLSRLMLILLGLGLAGLAVVSRRGGSGTGDAQGQGIFFASLGIFFLITLVFAPDLDPFFDAVFLGHQLREAVTHAFVTLPAAWWLCLKLSGGGDAASQKGAAPLHRALVAGLVGVLVGLYLLVGALTTSAASQGQTDSPVLLLCPHFFEHTFSYLVVPLVAGLVYESALLGRRGED